VLEENIFPSKNVRLKEPGRLAEERRLCYVGITRAMEKLYITYANLAVCLVVNLSIVIALYKSYRRNVWKKCVFGHK